MDPDLVRQQSDEEADHRRSLNGSASSLKHVRLVEAPASVPTLPLGDLAPMAAPTHPAPALGESSTAPAPSKTVRKHSGYSSSLTALFSVIAAVAGYASAIAVNVVPNSLIFFAIAMASGLVLAWGFITLPLMRCERLTLSQAWRSASIVGVVSLMALAAMINYAPSLIGQGSESGHLAMLWGLSSSVAFGITAAPAHVLLSHFARANAAKNQS